MRYRRLVPLFCLCVFGAVALPGWAEAEVDHSIYGDLLAKYVSDGVVDYQGLQQEESKLDQYLELLNNTDPEQLSRQEQYALYINAYNAYTLKLILENCPVESIKDIGGWFGSPWKIEFCKVGGEVYTLDEIEHDILRPRFKDPRVHFAVNCASKSCPPLIAEPYREETLDQQLDENTIAFLNDPNHNYLEDDTLYVSRIFKWFGGDFNDDPVSFVLQYAQGDLKEQLLARKDRIEVEYLDYDWSLNGQCQQ
ncbi:DUF547 domain-containing protein [candidate division KSB3 bacterium]|uniref:DUF547 domain-containing protein n=1 Tax=candidate division KSB3 bacterium TaxID=2044937 RepID=A0A9D5JWT6_9BACT|nr:DUF547 domain-containing protein [candidate division KSB3 bacterium]MBD3325579.1 DUF547 domain-containing protein [candidate division KSB3 bacterium]